MMISDEKLTMEDVETIREIFHTPLTGSFNWDYDSANAKIRRLYELGKKFNWNPTDDIIWDAPCNMDDYPSEPSLSALNGYPEYEALSEQEKIKFSWKAHAQTMSQFLHGEQGALLVASQLVSRARRQRMQSSMLPRRRLTRRATSKCSIIICASVAAASIPSTPI